MGEIHYIYTSLSNHCHQHFHRIREERSKWFVVTIVVVTLQKSKFKLSIPDHDRRNSSLGIFLSVHAKYETNKILKMASTFVEMEQTSILGDGRDKYVYLLAVELTNPCYSIFVLCTLLWTDVSFKEAFVQERSWQCSILDLRVGRSLSNGKGGKTWSRYKRRVLPMADHQLISAHPPSQSCSLVSSFLLLFSPCLSHASEEEEDLNAVLLPLRLLDVEEHLPVEEDRMLLPFLITSSNFSFFFVHFTLLWHSLAKCITWTSGMNFFWL